MPARDDPSVGPTLSDDVIDLRLLRVLAPGDLSARSAEARFLAHAPEHRFAIHRRTDGLRVGRIHLRITDDPTILGAVGHMGFAVEEAHRRNGYATRAIRLILDLARRYRVSPLWILIEPGNTPSRRAVERVGFDLFDEIDSPPEAVALGLGARLCRYVMEPL